MEITNSCAPLMSCVLLNSSHTSLLKRCWKLLINDEGDKNITTKNSIFARFSFFFPSCIFLIHDVQWRACSTCEKWWNWSSVEPEDVSSELRLKWLKTTSSIHSRFRGPFIFCHKPSNSYLVWFTVKDLGQHTSDCFTRTSLMRQEMSLS